MEDICLTQDMLLTLMGRAKDVASAEELTALAKESRITLEPGEARVIFAALQQLREDAAFDRMWQGGTDDHSAELPYQTGGLPRDVRPKTMCPLTRKPAIR